MAAQLPRRIGQTRSGARPLLSKVNGKPHARIKDHEPDPNSSRRTSALLKEPENVYDDPIDISSDDESQSMETKPEWGSPMNGTAASSATSVELGDTASDRLRKRGKGQSKELKSSGNGGLANSHAPASMLAVGHVDGAQESDDDVWKGMGSRNMESRVKKRKVTTYARPKVDTNFYVTQKKSPSKSVREEAKQAKKKEFLVPPTLPGATAILGEAPKFKGRTVNQSNDLSSADEESKSTGSSFRSTKALPIKATSSPRVNRPFRKSSRLAFPEPQKSPPQFRNITNLDVQGTSDLNAFSKDFESPPEDISLVDSAPGGNPTHPFLHSSQASTSANRIIGDADSEELSEPPSSDELDEAKEALEDEFGDMTKCPYCDQPVSRSALYKFNPGNSRSKRMKINQQAKFCRSHRRADARLEWSKRGYPNIDWAELPSRITLMHDHILAVIEQRIESIFRRDLEEKIDSGRHRTLAQSLRSDAAALDALVPGYYGGRGAKIIAECLTNAFAAKIRERAGKERDKTTAAVGVSGFVQAVLVPEVGMKLVMEDLSIKEEKAVGVLREAAEMGDLLFDGEDDEGATQVSRW